MGRRLALLIATYEHEDPTLRRLVSPAADVESLAAVLRDPRIAGFEVTVLVNEPHYRVGEAIAELYRGRRRDDLTLLYFTGHGLKDDDGRLYLAASNTRRDSLLFTSLPAEQLDHAVEGCASRQKVLVLDCCYSGAFPAGRGVKADTEVHALEMLQGRGRIVLTASDSTQYSFEGDRVHGSATPSVFTRHLVGGLGDGSADLDGDGDITVDELYSYVHDRVVEEMPRQRPKKQSDVEGRIVVARNVGWTLPGYVRNALGSPIATDRLGAIDALLHLHRIGNATVREQVAAEVERLVDDDSRAVSAAAVDRLQALRRPSPPEAEPAPAGERPPVAPSPPVPEPAVPDPPAGRPPDPPARRRSVLIAAAAFALVAVVVVSAVLVPNRGGELTPLGPVSRERVAAVPVGADPGGIDFFDDGGRLAVVAVAAGFVMVDRTTNAVIGRFDLPGQSTDVAVVPGGNRTYVATSAGLAEFDTSQPSAVLRGTPVEGQVYGVAAAPDGNRVYAAVPAGVAVVDPVAGAVLTTIDLPGQKFGLAVRPDSARVYVANADHNTVSVIDAGTAAVIDTIDTGAFALDVAISPDGARGYIAQESAVSVFDAGTDTVLATIPIPDAGILAAIAVTPDGRRILAVTRDDGRMFEIDAAVQSVVERRTTTLLPGAALGDVAVSDDRAYVSVRPRGELFVLDISEG